MAARQLKATVATALLAVVAACSGGGGAAPAASTGSSGGTVAPTPSPPSPPPPPPPVAAPAAPAGYSATEAARFLTQATFGATEADISTLGSKSFATWIDQQISLPRGQTALNYMEQRMPQGDGNQVPQYFYEYFWREAVTAPDQLRQRMTFALSQIFVISFANPNVIPRGMASYYDMLNKNAFGNFRTLLEDVTLHPMMGLYLSHLGNQKENLLTGQNPDQNYAREIMQLMSIGLYELNIDGTVKKDASGNPIPAYTQDDVANLAKVFTGISWFSRNPTDRSFLGGDQTTLSMTGETWVSPMMFYPSYHSTSAKKFLGVSIPASATPDVAGNLKIALDTIFNHPNVGPFIGRQLIQRFVTSNPSPAYVSRVAAVFNNNGKGVRGDMAAVIRAVLLDSEARTVPPATDRNYGKLREPILRVSNAMRTFRASSTSNNWQLHSTSSSLLLGQSVLSAPSVFNFYRPGFVLSNSQSGTANLHAPEFQIADEITVASYVNFMRAFIGSGIGRNNDISLDLSRETAIAQDGAALVERMNVLLLNGNMSPALKQRILTTIEALSVANTGNKTPTEINEAKALRARIAVFLTMISPEYMIQR